MKKFLIIITLSLILGGNAYANSKEVIKTDGFLIPTNKWKDKIKINGFNLENPPSSVKVRGQISLISNTSFAL